MRVPWNRAIICLLTVLALMAFVAGCSCGDDDDNDDSSTPTDDTADDTSDDTGPDSPVLDHPVDETISLPCLTSEARVALDEYAIPYIFAASQEDLMCVLGYVEAHYRMFQMDFLRHLCTGRLTEYVGDVALDTDLYYRTVFMADDGTSVFDKIQAGMDGTLVALLQKYTDGINAWLAEKRDSYPDTDWPEEYLFNTIFPSMVPDWEIRDTISIARYQTWDLSNSLGDELEMTQYADVLDADLYAKIFTRKPWTDTTVLPSSKGGDKVIDKHPHPILPAGYMGLKRTLETVRAAQLGSPLSRDGQASNNWIVSPSINDGIGYLANDPHLSLTYPSVFMIGFMDNKELGGGAVRTWGSIFPGTPLVVIGANSGLAWGETVAGYDVLDVYQEQLVLDGGTPTAVEYDGGEVDLIASPQSFTIAGSEEPTEVTVYVAPHHGPILSDSIDGTTALSFRWTGHEPTFEVSTFWKLANAGTVDEGFAAIDDFQVGAQNFVLQDTSGDIGYFPNALVPVRDWDLSAAPPWHVLPGDGSAEWNGYIPADKMPKSKNPERGFLCTANNDINGTLQTGDPTAGEYYWYYDRDIGFRAQRIDALLTEQSEGDGFSMDSMKATQTDILSGYARDMLSAVVAAISSESLILDPDAQTIFDMWQDWSYNLDSGLDGTDPDGAASGNATALSNAVCAMTFGVFEALLKQKTYGDELAAEGVDFPYWRDDGTVAMLTLLTDGADDAIWDDVSTGPTETSQDIIKTALNETAAVIPTLVRRGGTDAVFEGLPVEEWYWGRLHNLVLGHIAFSPFGISVFDKGPYALPGGLYTVNVAGYSMDGADFVTDNGPALRIIHEFTGGTITTQLTIPGGETPIVDDPHELDLLQLYLAHEYYPIPNTVDSILNATVYMYAFTKQ